MNWAYAGEVAAEQTAYARSQREGTLSLREQGLAGQSSKGFYSAKSGTIRRVVFSDKRQWDHI